jgi:hypothetical protein
MQTGRTIGTALAVAAIVVDPAGYDHIAILERGSLTVESFAVPADTDLGSRYAAARHGDKPVGTWLASKQVARISGALAQIPSHLYCLAPERIALPQNLGKRERLFGGAASSDPGPNQGDRQPHSFAT